MDRNRNSVARTSIRASLRCISICPRGEFFGSDGHHPVKADQEQNKREFDVQPRRVKIIVRIRRDQTYAGKDGQQRSGIGEPSQEDALQASQSLPGIRRGFLGVARKRHGRHQQATDPKHQS